MVELSQELDFAFMAGSSLPVNYRYPEMELPGALGGKAWRRRRTGTGRVRRLSYARSDPVFDRAARRRGNPDCCSAVP